MPNPLEEELGLGPTMHRFRRRIRNVAQRMGMSGRAYDQRSLDPLTVNYAAWREVRRTVREWPHYKEAANSLEVLVSPEDWEDYWGIDTERKEASVSAYVQARAAEKNLWMSGVPQVFVCADDAVEPGEVEIVCQFVESEEDEPAFSTAVHEQLTQDLGRAGSSPVTTVLPNANNRADGRPSSTQERRIPIQGDAEPGQEGMSLQDAPTLRFVDAATAGGACLSDESGFRLEVESGDIVGVVIENELMPPEVNVRLDAKGFPYADTKHFQVGVMDGQWKVVNYAQHGTMLVKASGQRLMLMLPEPYPLSEGDVLYLGPERPLRFEPVSS